MKHRPDVDDVLAAYNPAPRVQGHLDARARADRVAIMGRPPEWETARATHRRPVLRGTVAVAAVLAAAVGVSVGQLPLLGHAHPAYAATPPPLEFSSGATTSNASSELQAIAVRAAASGDVDSAGRYAFVETQEWTLFTRVDGQNTRSVVVPEYRLQWLAPDGSGKLTVLSHEPRPTNESGPASPPGSFALMWPLRSLSPARPALDTQLSQGHPSTLGTAEAFTAVVDAYSEMPIPSAVRASMLDYLATLPGVTLSGVTRDRAGRSGLAFSTTAAFSGLPTQYTLIFDTRAGRLLDAEQTLTSSAGKLKVRIPAVTSYRVFLSASYNDRLVGP